MISILYVQLASHKNEIWQFISFFHPFNFFWKNIARQEKQVSTFHSKWQTSLKYWSKLINSHNRCKMFTNVVLFYQLVNKSKKQLALHF